MDLELFPSEQAKEIAEDKNYLITSFGRIFSVRSNKFLNFSNKINGAGYYGVYLGKRKCRMVHRLVAEAFIGRINKLEVNHKNCNKLDNRVENLEIVTPKQNIAHAIKNGRFAAFYKSRSEAWKKGGNPKAKITANQRDEILRLYKTGNYFQKDIGKMFGITQASVSAIVIGKTWR